MIEFTNALVNYAFNEIGVREETKNSGVRIAEYQSATTLGPGPHPWCAAFTAWCLRQTLSDKAVVDSLVKNKILSSVSAVESWRCKSARVFDWEPWAKKNKLLVIPNAASLAKRGDFVVYDFSHMGIVALDQLTTERVITAIEGNTNIRGSRNGDGVYAKTRRVDPSVIACYIRMPI